MKEDFYIWCKYQANPHDQTRKRIVRSSPSTKKRGPPRAWAPYDPSISEARQVMSMGIRRV